MPRTENTPLTTKLHHLNHWTVACIILDVKLHVSDPVSSYTPTAHPDSTQVTHPFCSKILYKLNKSYISADALSVVYRVQKCGFSQSSAVLEW